MASPLPPEPVGVRVRVPAKINLALKVGPPRSDGFHPLATVFHAVSLTDEVRAVWAKADRFEVTATGEGVEQVPLNGSNLVVRAARLLVQEFGQHEGFGASFHITKSIPVAGGLAGGSADGAAALLACATLWGIDVTAEHFREMAAELGSDVPFALLGGTALGSGRGEHLVPALARGSYHWVLAFGHHGLSTPAVYRRFDEMVGTEPRPLEVPAGLMNALRTGDPARIGPELVNDLQPAAIDLQPRLQRVLDAGMEYGALGGIVSGSGPTCAFMVASESAAVDFSVALSADGVCRTVRRATGPVPGARVIS